MASTVDLFVITLKPFIVATGSMLIYLKCVCGLVIHCRSEFLEA